MLMLEDNSRAIAGSIVRWLEEGAAVVLPPAREP
jgi:hypothetical protein